MGAIASQITSLTIVYSIVYSDADQRKHQSSAPLAFVRGPVNSPHKWPVTRKMFPFDDVIMNCVILKSYDHYLHQRYISYHNHAAGCSQFSRHVYAWMYVRFIFISYICYHFLSLSCNMLLSFTLSKMTRKYLHLFYLLVDFFFVFISHTSSSFYDPHLYSPSFTSWFILTGAPVRKHNMCTHEDAYLGTDVNNGDGRLNRDPNVSQSHCQHRTNWTKPLIKSCW